MIQRLVKLNELASFRSNTENGGPHRPNISEEILFRSIRNKETCTLCLKFSQKCINILIS